MAKAERARAGSKEVTKEALHWPRGHRHRSVGLPWHRHLPRCTITLEDAPGGGTQFAVRLPAGAGQEALSAKGASPAESFAGGRILIVDDEPEVAQTLSDVLQPSGYKVELAEGGGGRSR